MNHLSRTGAQADPHFLDAKAAKFVDRRLMGAPVFIVGCGRSGTTVLRLMLDAHPKLAIPGESNFIRYRWNERRVYWTRGRFVPERLLEDILADGNLRTWGISADDVRDLVRAHESPGFADVVAAPFQVYARMHNKPRWGDKTPIYVLSIPALASLFPDSKFVHLIRDGRDVALSYLAIPTFEGGIWHAAWRWRDWVTAGVRSGKELGPERYIQLKYEELVTHTEQELRNLCQFLDLDFEAGMLRYYEHADQRLEAPSERIRFHSKASQPPSLSSRNWRTDMSPQAVRIFESVAGELLEELGYERALPRVPPATRLRALARTGLHSAHVGGSRAKKSAIRSLNRLAGQVTR
jgi:hypothetical protein